MDYRFTEEQLKTIIQHGDNISCACPAEVCEALLAVRALHETQMECLIDASDGPLKDSHGVISFYSEQVHKLLEECLQQVMKIEGWNPVTLDMPPAIRAMRNAAKSSS